MAEDAGRIKIDIDVESAKAKNNVEDVKKSIAGLKKSTEKSSSKSIFDNIQSSVSKAKNGISKLTSGVKAFNSGMSSAVNNSKKLVNTISNTYTELLSKIKLATSAIKSFISLYNSFSSAYETQSSAETRFAVALRNSSDATQDQIDSIKELTSEYQQLGVIGDEVQLTGLQKLSTYVSSAESVKKLLPVLNDMTAQQYGFAASSENALSIATVLGKVLNGNVSSLKKYGYSFDEAQEQLLKYGTEEQKVATLAEVIEASVGGMNNALANTPTGQITQLKNNFGDLKESIGELLTYVILPIAKYINVIIQRAIVGVKTLTEFIKSTFGIKTVAKDINSINSSTNNIDNKNIDNTSDSLNDLGKSADNTKKKVKSLLAPFDELNILADNSEDNIGSLTSELSDVDTDFNIGYGVSETIEIPNIKEVKKKIEDAINSINFEGLGINLANKLNGIIDSWDSSKSAKNLANKLNKVIAFANGFLKTANFNKIGKKVGEWINKFVFTFNSSELGKVISGAINGAVSFANGALTTTDFKALGESIGNFIIGVVGPDNLDYVGIGKALLNTLKAAINTVSGILSKVDFKEIGKGIAKAGNQLTGDKKVWADLAKTLSDILIGALDLAIGFLDEFNWDTLGAAIGIFIANIKWTELLSKAAEAIWKGLKAALEINAGIFKENPVAGFIIDIAGALLLFNGLSGVAGTIGGIVGALGGFKTIAFVAIATGILAVGNAIAQAGNDAFNSKLTSVLNSDIPAAEEDLNKAVEKIGLDFDNIVSSATSNGFLLNQETGKMVGYVDNMRIEIDAKTGEISGYYERLKLGDLPEVFGSALDSMSAKFDPNSTFVSNFKDGKQKVTDLQNEIKGIAPTIVNAGKDTDTAVQNLISALDKLKSATNEAKQSASNLILAYTSSSKELLEKNGVDINAIYSDINKATNYSKKLTDDQIERFKELAKKVSEGKQLTEQEATDYNELLNTLTGGNIKALQENKKELADYLDAIQNGRITFSDADEAKAVIEDITAKYKDASGKLSEYSEEINSAIETLELPDDIKKSYKEMFGNLLTVDQAELDTIFMNTKNAIGDELLTLYEEMGKGGYFKKAKASLYFKDAMDAARVTGEDFVGHISDGLTSSYNTTYLPAVQTFFSDASDDIKKEARGTIDAFADSLNDNVKKSANSLKEESKKLGEYTDDGLVEGLNKNKKKVTNASKDIAAIPGLEFKEYNEISSPSKLTKRYGEYIDDGLVIGLKSGIRKIEAMSKKIASTVVDELKIKSSQITVLKTYGYNYIDSFFKGIVLKGNELNKIVDILKRVINTFKITGTNSSILIKYGNTYINDYMSGIVLNNTYKQKISNIQNTVVSLLKPTNNTLSNIKTWGSSLIDNLVSGMNITSSHKTNIGNAITSIYNKMIESMNNLSNNLSSSSNTFINNLINPISNGLSRVLSGLDDFYVKFRNKWQATANLLSNPFIGNSMGVTKVPNLNNNYYPFGDNIVKLAQGAVIKPNNEFMAILGDQKRGLNIETPLATMKQAFIEALNEGNYAGGNITIPVYIGQEKLDTLIINSNNRRNMRNNGRG